MALSSNSSWSDHGKIIELQKQKADLQETVLPLESSLDKAAYLEDSLNIFDEEEGEFFLEEFRQDIRNLKKIVSDIELKLLLSEETDKNNAIVVIHPGAGGVESQDWAQMLMRMYLRWADKHSFKTEIIDLQPGDEAGIKDATFTVTGSFAFGYLKGEAGVHRLVRISPFDANKRRHTSFSAVLIYPVIEDDIKIEIRDEDLQIDTFRASGAGGQHVNKVSSAVRVTHIPTGIVVSCQSERSQLRNKTTALKILKSKLYNLNKEQKERKLEGLVGDKKDISWGNQIRSYILQPYSLVKDHRTGLEIGNVNVVLDGELDFLIDAFLRKSV